MLKGSVNDRLKKKTILRNLSVYSNAKILPPMTDQGNLEKIPVYSGVADNIKNDILW